MTPSNSSCSDLQISPNNFFRSVRSQWALAHWALPPLLSVYGEFTWRMTVLAWNIQVEVVGVIVGPIQVLLISDAVLW